jgi:hypothetical protein
LREEIGVGDKGSNKRLVWHEEPSHEEEARRAGPIIFDSTNNDTEHMARKIICPRLQLNLLFIFGLNDLRKHQTGSKLTMSVPKKTAVDLGSSVIALPRL